MEKASLWKLFGVFAKIGAFTIGGGYAMIPLIEREMTSRGWLSEKDMEDLIVLAQGAPGILAVNIAVFTGYRLSGLRGSVTAATGAVLPSFAIILLIAMFFTNFKDNDIVRRIFQGVRPVAVALILIPAINMARKGCRNAWTWAIAILTLIAVAFLKVSPIWIILTVLAFSTGIAVVRQCKKER